MKAKKLFLTLLLALLSLSLFASGAQEAYSDTAKAEEYLSVYFDLEVSESPSYEEFASALSAIVPGEWSIESNTDAVKAAVIASSLGEFAKTYSSEKAEANLAAVKISASKDAGYLAAAIDSGLLSAPVCAQVVSGASLSKADAVNLLMAVVEASGQGRNYIGSTKDPDIQAKIANYFKTIGLYSNEELDVIGAKLVQEQSSTGYGLKKEAAAARFLPSLSIRYGHDSEKHVKQLVALLSSEGISALIQVEPKTSIYEYLLDWGPVPEPSEDYYVEKFSDDLYLVHAIEFDLYLEFETIEDLEDFDSIINQYSKKNDSNQAEGSEVKLISGAWWQPLYSAVFNPDEEAYTEIVDNVLYSANGAYSIHPFTTVENSASLVERERALGEGEISVNTIYANNAFYRYLTGEDYQ